MKRSAVSDCQREPWSTMTDVMFTWPRWLISCLWFSSYLPYSPLSSVSTHLFSFSFSTPCSLTASSAAPSPLLPLYLWLCACVGFFFLACSWTTGASQWHSWSGCCAASLQAWSICQTWTMFTETSPPEISWSTATWSARSPTLACRAFWTTPPLTPLTQALWLVKYAWMCVPLCVCVHCACLIGRLNSIPTHLFHMYT